MGTIFQFFRNMWLIYNTEFGAFSIVFAVIAGVSFYYSFRNNGSVFVRLNVVSTAFCLVLSAYTNVNAVIGLLGCNEMRPGDITEAIIDGSAVVTMLPFLFVGWIIHRRLWRAEEPVS